MTGWVARLGRAAVVCVLFGLMSCSKPSEQTATDEPVQEDHAGRRDRDRVQGEPETPLDFIALDRLDEARTMLEAQLGQTTDRRRRDEIFGLITATYYGKRQHREGLAFLCRAYRGVSMDDHRFLFQAHAHIRRIRLNEGRGAALEAARDARRNCNNRSDFADVWASIPLALMENLDGRKLRRAARYVDSPYLTADDEAELNAYIDADLAGRPTPFVEYAYYFQRRYDELIARYPLFTGMELAMAERTRDAEYPRSRELLQTFLARYPETEHRDTLLYKVGNQVESREGGLAYARFMQQYGSNDIWPARYEIRDHTMQLMGQGQFQQALDYLRASRVELAAVGGSGSDTEEALEDLDALGAQIEDFLLPLPSMTPTEIIDKANLVRHELGWRNIPTMMLGHLAARPDLDPETRARTLYLLARSQQRSYAAADAITTFNRLIAEYPDHRLADDALAEIGWSQAYQLRDTDAALATLRQVERRFPRRNAVDNALWIQARILQREDDDAGAAALYARIAAGNTQRRLTQAARAIVEGESERPRQTASIGGDITPELQIALEDAGLFRAAPVRSFALEQVECGEDRSAGWHAAISAPPGTSCSVTLVATRAAEGLGYRWPERATCRLQRTQDGYAVESNCALANTPAALIGRRWTAFSGLAFEVRQSVEGAGDQRAWRSAIVVDSAESGSKAHNAGIREGWELREMCGTAMGADPQMIAEPASNRGCYALFNRPPKASETAPVAMRCRVKPRDDQVEVYGWCRRPGTFWDWFLGLFGF